MTAIILLLMTVVLAVNTYVVWSILDILTHIDEWLARQDPNYVTYPKERELRTYLERR